MFDTLPCFPRMNKRSRILRELVRGELKARNLKLEFLKALK
jgi:hypothetical protein